MATSSRRQPAAARALLRTAGGGLDLERNVYTNAKNNRDVNLILNQKFRQ